MDNIFYLPPCGCDELKPPPRMCWRFKIQCPDNVIKQIKAMFPDVYIFLKNTYPSSGFVYFYSRRVRDWAAVYIQNNFFMTWTKYPGIKDGCKFCGKPSAIIYNDVYLCEKHYQIEKQKKH